MNTYTLSETKTGTNIVTIRRRLLQIHSTILLLVALASAFYATIARLFGSLTFHMIWLVIETIAVLHPDPAK